MEKLELDIREWWKQTKSKIHKSKKKYDRKKLKKVILSLLFIISFLFASGSDIKIYNIMCQEVKGELAPGIYTKVITECDSVIVERFIVL